MRLSSEERFREIQKVIRTSKTIFGDGRLTEICDHYGSKDLYKIWWLATAKPEHDFQEPEIVESLSRKRSLLAKMFGRFWRGH